MTARAPLRVLHSFPHRLGAGRICTTAWYEIESSAAAGAQLTVMAGDVVRPLSRDIALTRTLRIGNLRVPHRLLGTDLTCKLHDWIVARELPKLANDLDIVHAWPVGALRTIKAARRLNIPVALERCNAHTRVAYQLVANESKKLGIELPRNHEHAFNPQRLEREEQEYVAADALLCPSAFTAQTFRDLGYPAEKLVPFIYGVDESVFFPAPQRTKEAGLRAIYVGVAAVRKGLHYALEAWLASSASATGEFWIIGEFLPAYREKLASMLAHPSVRVFGHRNDVPLLMRQSDVLLMPSIEEGFGLVCTEAMSSGCVPLVSNACTDLCRHHHNSLVHAVGDVAALMSHLDLLTRDRETLQRLRANGLNDVPTLTWRAAGSSLVKAYEAVLAHHTVNSAVTL